MRRLVSVAAALGLTLAACADGGDSGAGAPATTIRPPASTTEPSAPTTATTPASTATTAPPTAMCETVGFTPNSEDAASDIRATGLSCEEAEAFVRVAGRRTSSGGPEELDVEGYHCVQTGREEDPLPQASYTCTNGPKEISFVRT